MNQKEIERLQAKLDRIPETSAVNIARRLAILEKIYRLMEEEV